MTVHKTLVGLAAGLGFALCAVAAQAAEDPAAKPAIYAEKGEQTCLKCHDEAPYTDILKTPHAVKADGRTPFAQHGCESCHGASPDHVASRPAKGEKKARPAIVFGGPDASLPAERAAVCLTCHKGDAQSHWKGSAHAKNDVACNDCHTVHAAKDPILSKVTQPEKCFTCHSQQRAESFQYSHHPVREGKVACSDCHNTHGARGKFLLKQVNINETCYQCHAEKRGPLLFEHPPVRENCDNCHTPHGSSQASLLTERMPYLCSSCHDHHSVVFGNQDLPGGGRSVATGQALNGPQARSCTNCHSAVHGSNSPSGSALAR